MSEVENNEEVNQGNIGDFVDAIAQQNFNRAKDHFDSIVGDKMNDAIEAERINVADDIFNDAPEEQLELDLDDEEVVFDDETDLETTTDVEEVDEVEEDDISVDEVEEFEDEEEVN